MKKVTIVVFDLVKLSVKKAQIEQQDIVSIVNTLENNQIMIIKSIDNTIIFLRDKKIVPFTKVSSIRSAIENL